MTFIPVYNRKPCYGNDNKLPCIHTLYNVKESSLFNYVSINSQPTHIHLCSEDMKYLANISGPMSRDTCQASSSKPLSFNLI